METEIDKMDKISNNQPSTRGKADENFLPHLAAEQPFHAFFILGPGEAFSIMTKTCSKCGKDKPLDAFTIDRQARDGLAYSCKACVSVAKKQPYKKTRNTEWHACLFCLGKIGLGWKVAQKITGKWTREPWRKNKIISNTPEEGSWLKYCHNKNKTKSMCERLIMQDITIQQTHGFSWYSFWRQDINQVKQGKKQKTKTWSQKKKTDEEKAKEKARKKEAARRRELMLLNQKTDNRTHAKIVRRKREQFRGLLKTAKKGGSNIKSGLIGCTTKELRHHIESQFTRLMSWDNHGTCWQVDHIIPCAAFDHTRKRNIKKCWHWTNLQPLYAEENHAKGCDIEEPQLSLLIDYVA
jgi:hypothetical protein